MSKLQTILKLIVRIILLMLLAFVILIVLVALGFNEGMLEASLHLIGGFVFFLSRNVPAISVNAATWVPGVVSFLLALFVGHRFLRAWAARRNRDWNAKTTVCLGLFLPVLFIIAFIIPGVILQADSLGDCQWFQSRRGQEIAMRMAVLNCTQACWYLASDAPGERFPDSLDAIKERDLIDLARYIRTSLPREPFIYLGAGLTMSSDGNLPLCISPPYREDGENFRQVATLDGKTIQIRDEDVDEWIDRVFPRTE